MICKYSYQILQMQVGGKKYQDSYLLTRHTELHVKYAYSQTILKQAITRLWPTIGVQCTCEQSPCVFMWKLGLGLSLGCAAGRAHRDSEVHLSPINLCLYLCVSRWTREMSPGLNHDRLTWWVLHPEKTPQTTGYILCERVFLCVYFPLCFLVTVCLHIYTYCVHLSSL